MVNELGIDRSGNNNTWTVNNMTLAADQMVDSPTNNFCTWNPLANEPAGVGTLAEGNLKGTTGSAYNGFGSTMHIIPDGKTYIEFTPTAIADDYYVGVLATEQIAVQTKFYNGGPFYGYRTDGLFIYNTSDDPADEANVSTDVNTFGVGDIGQLAIDTTANKIWIGKNNTWQFSGTQNPSAGTGGYSMTAHPAGWQVVFGTGSVSSSNTAVVNFGQDSSFAGNKTAQGNQDSNSIGDFYYTPPTDFLALCTSNLPDPAVTPSEHFNTVLYTGDDGTDNNITGVGFQPDFVWLKPRNLADHHRLNDSVRGVNKTLSSNQTNTEQTSSNNYLGSFDSDGFTIDNADAGWNSSSYNYVAWNWKANGSGSSNEEGSINTTATSANTDAGFSIVSWTGNDTNGATLGHGLDSTPQLIITKRRDGDAISWYVYNETIGNTKYLKLDDTLAETTSAIWNDTSPTATLFSVSGGEGINSSSNAYIAYCFHSVDGFSKVGSYEGNGSTDGTFVYTGFRPAWMTMKRTDSTGHWYTVDNERDGYNASTSNDVLYPNLSNLESDAGRFDFYSNGFKLRHADSDINASGGTYIYIAFAESPFKYSNAR